MAEAGFIAHGGVPWIHGQGSMTPSRLRTLSPMPKKEVTRSISVPQLARAANMHMHMQQESDGINTIPDPRAATPQPPSHHHPMDSHPDLSQEVSALSTKLINAINHSTMLDDSLQQTRHDLEEAREQLFRLEALVRDHEERISKGLLVDKIVYDKMEKQLSSEVQEERKRRIEAEKAKRKTDGEVEALTAALFEEANVMVAAARRETEASDRRANHLKQQIVDAQVLQNSLQEQLADMKEVVATIMDESDDNDSKPRTSTPSMPATPQDKMTALFEAVNLTPLTPGANDIRPDQPLAFSHLISPILRSDITVFTEFQEMCKISARSSAPSSRVSSGNYGSLNVLGLGSLSNGSSTSLPGLVKVSNASGNSSPRESFAGVAMPNLKDDKFYKRALLEDVEPTLRLDLAPGLSWMARRTVHSSITTGSLCIEPNPTHVQPWRTPVLPCSLCGEARKGDEYARKFRFKASDTEEAQRYPLCDWCMSRVRATCDYIGFLRMVAAGHWRAETEEERKSTWEESVRLRERMFWARMGGGVVPSFVPLRPDTPMSPMGDGVSEQQILEAFEPRDVSVPEGGPVQQHNVQVQVRKDYDPYQGNDGEKLKQKRMSLSSKRLSRSHTHSRSSSVASPSALTTPAALPQQKEEEKQVQPQQGRENIPLPASTPQSESASAPPPDLLRRRSSKTHQSRQSLDMRKLSSVRPSMAHRRWSSNPPVVQQQMGNGAAAASTAESRSGELRKKVEERLNLRLSEGTGLTGLGGSKMPGGFD